MEDAAAFILLASLGVSATPPPGDPAESLGGGMLGQAWQSGAVAPFTFRGLAGMLLVDMPPELLVEVGSLLAECGARAGQEGEQRIDFLFRLRGMRHPVLDSLPGRPLVGVNLDAPQRTITEAVEVMVRRWKDDKGITERRCRDDKLSDYLDVWDLREGWAGDHYDGASEQTMLQIVQELRIPLSTAVNRCRSAFRLIVGRDYAPALWARVLGFLKAREWLGPADLPRRTLRRPWRDRQARLVPKAVLQSPGGASGAGGSLVNLCVSADEINYTDLIIDIQDLIGRGWVTADIIKALELTSPAAAELIEFMRVRQGERL